MAVADSRGTVHDPAGLDLAELERVKEEQGSVVHSPRGTVLPAMAGLEIDCDILIPAATPDVIHEGNVAGVKARLVLEGANIPATPAAETLLQERGVLVVPDFIANAGGVIMAALEYAGKNADEAFAAIDRRITRNTRLVLERAAAERILPRAAALALAEERVRRAMTYQDF